MKNYWLRVFWRLVPGFCLWSLFVLIQSCSASTINPADEKYLHQIWRMDDGLPNPFVRAIRQTRDGYLWLVLDDAVGRFDGLHFTEFEHKTVTNRVDRWCVGLVEGRDGAIWFSSANGGLSRVKDNKLTRYTTEDGLLNNYVMSLFEDRSGTLWIGTIGGLCQWTNGKFVTRTNEPGLVADAVRMITDDHDGNIWIATSKGLCCYRDNKFTTFTAKDFLANDAVMCVYEDHKNTLWIGTSDGLTHVVDGKSVHYTTARGLLHKAVRAMVEDDEGTMWIGTQGGLQRFINGRFYPVNFKTFNDPDFEGVSFVYSMCIDREGSLWVGTNLGLNRFQRQRFESITTEDGLLHNLSTLVYEDREKNVWIGTYGGGLSKMEGKTINTWTTANGLTNDFILALCEDHEGSIWIGMDGGGLQRFKDGEFSHYTIAGDIQANSVSLIFEDSKTNLWVCSNAGAFQLIDGKLIQQTNFPRMTIKAVAEYPAGTYWVGWPNGLMKITGATKTNYTEKNGLLSAAVNRVYRDAEDVFWIGTDRGLNMMKDGKFFSCPLPGRKDPRILQILEDDYNRLWFGTRDGIFSANKKDLIDYIDHKITNFNLITFGKKDGMRRTQCNGIASPAGWKTSDGRLWFATMHGMVVFDPKQIHANTVPPPVMIDEVLVADKVKSELSGAVFSPGENEIEFRYTALSFIAPEQITFKYKLEGFDTQWHDVGTRRGVRYTNLRAGNYRFRVQACNADGLWSEKDAEYAFVIVPFFYQTTWFYLMCAGALIVMAAGLHFYRMINMRMREVELVTLVEKRTVKLQEIIKTMESFNYSIAHDLRAPLRAIKGFTNALVEDYSAAFDAIGMDYSKRIQHAVDRMDRLIDDLLVFGRLTHKEITLSWVSLETVLTQIQAELGIEIVRRHAKLTIRRPLPKVWANETLLVQVLSNLISNGMKFVAAGTIPLVEVWVEEGELVTRIFVRDNGIGIESKHYQKIFGVFERLHSTEAYPGTGIGLAIVQKAVERMDGKVGLKSQLGEGSCFWIELSRPPREREKGFQTDRFRGTPAAGPKPTTTK